MVVAVGLTVAPSAGAHRFPAQCDTNGLSLDIKDPGNPIWRPGETITYEVRVGNTPAAGAPCLVDGASVSFALPGANGVALRPPTVFTRGPQSYAAGRASTRIGLFP
jgi:hypothetical protein